MSDLESVNSIAGLRQHRSDGRPAMIVKRFADGLYRGSEPTNFGDVQWLKHLGISTILDLQVRSGNFILCSAIHLRMIQLQLQTWPIRPPKFDCVYTALQIMSSPCFRPVFVHCREGVDRTGYIVAQYRVQREGWTRRRAIDEMFAQGMHWDFRWWSWFIPEPSAPAGFQ